MIHHPIGERKRSQAQNPKPFPRPKELLFGKRLPFLCKILGMLLGIALGHAKKSKNVTFGVSF